MRHGLAADFTPPDTPAAPPPPGRNRAGGPCPNQCTTRYGDNNMPVAIQPTGGHGTELWCPACQESFGRE